MSIAHSKMKRSIWLNYLETLIRFGLAFGLGYLLCVNSMLVIQQFLQHHLPLAESVFLSAVIALILYLFFVLMVFMLTQWKQLIGCCAVFGLIVYSFRLWS